MDGLVLVLKPLGITSHDVVDLLRGILGEKRVGHFGTLDPLASGLLLVAVGKATRLFPFFGALDKTYRGSIRLGFSTDTYDAAGRPTSTQTLEFPSRKVVEAALRQFEGEITQIAPPFSAKKFHGKPLYVFARKNEAVEDRASRVHVRSIRLTGYSPPLAGLEVMCSSGTYIRSLAHDLGQKLECGAHLDRLVRTKIGDYDLSDALPPEEIKALREAGRTAEFLKPLEALLPFLPRLDLTDEGCRLVKNGRPVSSEHLSGDMAALSARSAPGGPAAVVRLFSPGGGLAALARPSTESAVLAPFIVF